MGNPTDIDRMKELDFADKRDLYLREKYGICEDEYQTILAEQGGKCAICKKIFRGPKRMPAVDHDHKTGKVRGVLCPGCNLWLGRYENKSFLNSVREYLSNPPAQQ